MFSTLVLVLLRRQPPTLPTHLTHLFFPPLYFY
jgi:hypothetical protein